MPEDQPRAADGAAARARVPARYALEKVLGQGGMGAVYRVRDHERDASVALKRLILKPDPPHDPDAHAARLALFHREYQVLSQMSHPSAVRVFDYGVDELGPYYTMELLEGSDIGELAPLPWKRACRLARDTASCLAILHSRRLLHRDVSPANVLCSKDGRGKLIDFGGMCEMGPATDIVGTPPCIPPEALRRQPLDPRSDLYGLGAVLYFALTRKHAYPARSLRELAQIWKRKPRAPSEWVAEVPEALDQLVLSLLSPDTAGRPLNAAEVIDRIEAIAEIPPDPLAAAARAYLTTPTLVAREAQLEEFRSRLEPAGEGRGAVVVVEAEAGLGRTRLLGAFALEAKLVGAAVLEAGLADASTGPFGMVRAWVRHLLTTLQEPALRAAQPYAATLGHELPELHERMGRPELEAFPSEAERRLRVQADALDWLRAIAREHRIVVLADDLQRADAESAAVLVGLAEDVAALQLVVIASSEKGAPSTVGEAERLLRENAKTLSLDPLNRAELGELLASIFGSASGLDVLADWIHQQTAGNPRLCMDLAEYLLDRGHVRYEGGAWVLPENPGKLTVPTAFEEILAQRMTALSTDARTLATSLALATPGMALEESEYASLLDGADATARASAAAQELCVFGVFLPAGAGHVFARSGYAQVLEAQLSDEQRRERHRALARAYAARAVPPFVTAHHLHLSGEDARALDWLLDRMEHSTENLSYLGSPAVVSGFEAALAEAKRQERSPRARVTLLSGLLDCASQVDAALSRYADELLEHLRRDTGLDFWEASNPTLDPVQRTRAALAKARERHERTPEGAQGMAPEEAVASLGNALRKLQSAYVRCRDVRGNASLAGLIEPFAALSPTAAFSFDVLRLGYLRSLGREIGGPYVELVNRSREGIDGVDPEQVLTVQLTVGYYAALWGCSYESMSDWVLARADELERAPMFEAMAWQLRVHYHLVHGSGDEIASCRRQRDLAQVRSPSTSQHAITGARMELVMAGRFNDLMQLKSLLAPLDAQAALYPGWRPIAGHAHGEYHFARGEWDAAREHFEAALDGSGAFAWRSDIAARCIETMLHQGEAQAAYERAIRVLEDAESDEVDWLEILSLRLAAGLAAVAAGRRDEGYARIYAARDDVEARGVLDLYAGSAETLARAALYAGDGATFDYALDRLDSLYRPGGYPPLLAKLERIAEEGRRRFGEGDDLSPEQKEERARAASLVIASLDAASGSAERISRAIALLLRESGACGGFLFGIRDGELAWLGSHDGREPSQAIEREVREFFEAQTDTAEESADSFEGREAIRWQVDGGTYVPALLPCSWKGELCIAGVVVLEAEAGREARVSEPLLTALAEHLAGAAETGPVPWLDL